MLFTHAGQAVEPQCVPAQTYPWYALRVKSRCEKMVAHGLRERGYSEFLPEYISIRRWSDRLKKMQTPLFPGYLFCRFDFNNRLPVVSTPGVVRVIGLGKLPLPVDEGEISALQIAVRSGLLLQPWPFLKVGERVTIQEGPLRNVDGVILRMSDRDRLVISVTLLQRAVAISLERSWVKPKSA